MTARGRLLKYFIINFFANLFVFRSFRFRLKLECEKLASEKTEMQRHYVMVSELDLRNICAQNGGVTQVSDFKVEFSHNNARDPIAPPFALSKC